MAAQQSAEPKKGGFFSRKTEPAQPAATVSAQPGTATAPVAKPVAPPLDIRVSLEMMPEIEKRIDRMDATRMSRRQSLMERYEAKFGEKLELPVVEASVEEDVRDAKEIEVAVAARSSSSVPVDRIDAAIGAKPGVAARTGVPAKPGVPVRPGAPARPGAVAARPPAPPKMVDGKTLGQFMWPAIWPFWGLPMRAYAKFNWPDNRSKWTTYTIIDLPLWVLLFIPRLLGLFWVGLIMFGARAARKKMDQAEKETPKPAEGASEKATPTD